MILKTVLKKSDYVEFNSNDILPKSLKRKYRAKITTLLSKAKKKSYSFLYDTCYKHQLLEEDDSDSHDEDIDENLLIKKLH